jgi:hypothetical protein
MVWTFIQNHLFTNLKTYFYNSNTLKIGHKCVLLRDFALYASTIPHFKIFYLQFVSICHCNNLET